MKAIAGMKVTGYKGTCIGLIIDANYHIGTITKVNKKSIKVNITVLLLTEKKKFADIKQTIQLPTPYGKSQKTEKKFTEAKHVYMALSP